VSLSPDHQDVPWIIPEYRSLRFAIYLNYNIELLNSYFPFLAMM
jgi:hypothetical protein